MLEWATSIIERMGYGGIVFFLMVLENVFPPIPSEVILPFAGFTASKGRLSLIGVIVAAYGLNARRGAPILSGLLPWH
jgi:membrane protein DedA with SNARE-associated domain